MSWPASADRWKAWPRVEPAPQPRAQASRPPTQQQHDTERDRSGQTLRMTIDEEQQACGQ